MDNWMWNNRRSRFAVRRWNSIRHDRRTGSARLGGVRFLFGRVEDVTLDAVLGDDADANNAAGAAIVVHGMQNGCCRGWGTNDKNGD